MSKEPEPTSAGYLEDIRQTLRHPIAKAKENSFLGRFLFFFVSLAYGEICLRFFLYGSLGAFLDVLYLLLFTAVYALIAVLLTGIFHNVKANLAVAIGLEIIAFVAFSAQYIYYLFFKTPLQVFSIFHAGQVGEFAGEALSMIVRHLPELIALLLPLLVLCLFGRHMLTRIQPAPWTVLVLITALMLGVSCLALRFSGTAPASAYNLYYHENNPVLTQQKLGVMTAMRLDAQRTIFGFSPQGAASDDASGALPSADNADGDLPAISYQPNSLDIDFDRLIAQTTDSELQEMHRYFASCQPSLQNEYTGLFAGDNLLFIVAEGLYYPLAEMADFFPALHHLTTSGWQFSNFYNPLWGVSTSDGEYVALTGLLPKRGVWSFSRSAENYLPFTLGRQFQALGYEQVLAYHNHTYTYYDRDRSHPNMGYQYQAIGNGLDIPVTWPESDLDMLNATIDNYLNADNFHVYYLTVSGHMEYNFSGNMMAYQHRGEVMDLPYSEEVQAYIACNLELEYMLEELLSRLQEAGRLDDTVIVLTADHYPYGLTDEAIDELVGHQVEQNFELYRNSFVIWKDGLAHQVIDTPMSTLDILPTVANLFALPFDSRLLMGQDIFSASEPLVIFDNRSWISAQGSYNAATGETTGQMPAEYIDAVNARVAGKFAYSAKILERDYYRQVVEQPLVSYQ